MKLIIIAAYCILSIQAKHSSITWCDEKDRDFHPFGKTFGSYIDTAIRDNITYAKNQTAYRERLSKKFSLFRPLLNVTGQIEFHNDSTPDIASYIHKWGGGVGGDLYGKNNSEGLTSGSNGTKTYLHRALGTWLYQYHTNVRPLSYVMQNSSITIFRQLVNFFGDGAATLTYAVLVANKAALTDPTNPSSVFVPHFETTWNDVMGVASNDAPDICANMTSEECTEFIGSALGDGAANYLNNVIFGTYISIDAIQQIQEFRGTLKVWTDADRIQQHIHSDTN